MNSQSYSTLERIPKAPPPPAQISKGYTELESLNLPLGLGWKSFGQDFLPSVLSLDPLNLLTNCDTQLYDLEFSQGNSHSDLIIGGYRYKFFTKLARRRIPPFVDVQSCDSPNPSVPLANIRDGLGQRSWLLNSIFAGPLKVQAKFKTSVSEEQMINMWLSDTNPIYINTTTNLIQTEGLAIDGQEFGLLALYPSGLIRGIRGEVSFQLDKQLISIQFPNPLFLVDPEFQAESIPAGHMASLDLVVISRNI